MAQYVQCKKCQAPVGKYETPCPKCGADRRSARTAEPVRRFEYPCTEVQHIPCFYRELEYLSRMDEHSRETHAFHTLLQCCLVAESNQQLFEAALKLATLFDAPVRVLVVDSPRNKILPTVREGPLAALDAELKLTSVDGGIDAHGERLILLITDILLLDDQWEQRDCFRIMREDGRERQPRLLPEDSLVLCGLLGQCSPDGCTLIFPQPIEVNALQRASGIFSVCSELDGRL